MHPSGRMSWENLTLTPPENEVVVLVHFPNMSSYEVSRVIVPQITEIRFVLHDATLNQ